MIFGPLAGRIINFYPRPPRGGRPAVIRLAAPAEDFYPRPPRGGRPLWAWQASSATSYFYPRPPRGGRRAGCAHPPRYRAISTHALREEGDQAIPTLVANIPISTHALREEGDLTKS